MGNIEKAISLTDYFISLPPVKYFIASILLLGIIFGIVIDFGKYEGFNLIIHGALNGMILLSLPALLTSFAIKLMIRRISFKRIAATTFVGEVIYFIVYTISNFLLSVDVVYTEVAQIVILLGAALVFILWYVVGRLIFVLKYRSILFSIVQLLFHIGALIFTSSMVFLGDAETSFAKFYLSAFVFLAALYLFLFIINAPMKRNFGVSSTDAISFFMGQWLSQEKELEEAFEKVGENARTVLTFLSFKRKNDSIFFVTPYVHYGPFGNLGGSEFSFLLSDYLSKKYNAKSFVFHGTVTHDLNPVASGELGKILTVCDDILKKATYSNARGALCIGNYKECFAESLVVNDCAFVGLSRAPLVTEDINFGVGLSLMSEAEKHIPLAFVVDQHNSETGEITSFEPGSEIAYNYQMAIINSLALKMVKKPLSLGVAEQFVINSSIGSAGIKVAMFSTTTPKFAYVIIYFDANGVAPEFREKLMGEIKKLGKNYAMEWHISIYTTDTHEINAVKGVLNPLKEAESIIDTVKTLCVEAMYDLQPTKVYAEKRWFDIEVIGAKQSIELISTINSIVAVAKIIGPLILLGSLFAVAFLLGFV